MKTWFNNENMGSICVLGAFVFAGVAQFQGGEGWLRFIPTAMFLLAGGMFRGLVTWQNIVDLKKKD